MPKEIFVTEIKEDAVRHLYMCRMCGDEYIKNLADADVVTKSLEVVSSDGNVSHNERVIQGDQDDELLNQTIEGQFLDDDITGITMPIPLTEPQRINKIKAIEAKMQAAIDKEDYESAAKLRDILKHIQDEKD